MVEDHVYSAMQSLTHRTLFCEITMSESTEKKRKSRFMDWFEDLDLILRGKVTRPSDVQSADIRIRIVRVIIIVIMLAVITGFCMGVFALIRGFETGEFNRAMMQTGASMAKVPMLFLLTLIVTFPSLYVFNALVGSQLRMIPVLKLLVASLAVNLAVLASMGPIVAFFSASTPNYNFIVLLNVVVYALAGCLGLIFLVQTLNRLTEAQRGNLRPDAVSRSLNRTSNPADEPVIIVDASEGEAVDGSDQSESDPEIITGMLVNQGDRSAGPLDQLEGVSVSRNVKTVFTIWIIVFGLVGAQMGWMLRPFIGFEFFRARDSNFFEAVSRIFVQFVSGN